MLFFATKEIKLTPQNLITREFLATKRIKIVPAFRVWTKMTFRALVVAELIRGGKSGLKVQFRNHFSVKASFSFTWTGNKDTIFTKKKILRTKSFFIVMFLRFHPTAAQTATASFVTSEDVLPQLNPLLWAGTLRHQHFPIVFVLRIFFFISLFFCHHSTLFYGRHSSVSTFLIFSHSLHSPLMVCLIYLTWEPWR